MCNILKYKHSTHLSLMDICLADMKSVNMSPSSVIKSVSHSCSLLQSTGRCGPDSVSVCARVCCVRETPRIEDESCVAAASVRTAAVCTGRSVYHRHRKHRVNSGPADAIKASYVTDRASTDKHSYMYIYTLFMLRI